MLRHALLKLLHHIIVEFKTNPANQNLMTRQQNKENCSITQSIQTCPIIIQTHVTSSPAYSPPYFHYIPTSHLDHMDNTPISVKEIPSWFPTLSIKFIDILSSIPYPFPILVPHLDSPLSTHLRWSWRRRVSAAAAASATPPQHRARRWRRASPRRRCPAPQPCDWGSDWGATVLLFFRVWIPYRFGWFWMGLSENVGICSKFWWLRTWISSWRWPCWGTDAPFWDKPTSWLSGYG